MNKYFLRTNLRYAHDYHPSSSLLFVLHLLLLLRSQSIIFKVVVTSLEMRLLSLTNYGCDTTCSSWLLYFEASRPLPSTYRLALTWNWLLLLPEIPWNKNSRLAYVGHFRLSVASFHNLTALFAGKSALGSQGRQVEGHGHTATNVEILSTH